MNRLPLFRIIACFLLVFALGALTGWFLRPPAVPAGARGPSADRVLDRFDARFNLNDHQKERLAPILAEWEKEVSLFPRRPRWRLQLLDKYSPLVREVLTPAQQPGFDEMHVESREFLESRIRRFGPAFRE